MINKQPTSLTEINTFLSRWNRFVSVLIVALYNTLSFYKLLYISQSFSRPFCLFHSRTKQVSFLKTPQSLRPGQYSLHQVYQYLVLASRNIVYLSLFDVV